MGGIEPTVKNSVMIAIFVVAIITFAVQFANDNDSDINLSNDTRFDNLNNNLKQNLTQLKNDSETSKEILDLTSITGGDQEIAGSGGQFKIGPFTAISLTIMSIKTGFNSIFGEDFNFILIAFTSLLTFLIGYYIIKMWLGKSSE